MNKWTLRNFINRFDHCFGEVGSEPLPPRQSDEYRQKLLQAANDVIFLSGRYSQTTEYLLEMYEISEVRQLMTDLKAIDALTPAERERFGFYRDLLLMCYPLYRARQIDWTAWPWLLTDGTTSCDNGELCSLISLCERPCLSAALLYDLQEQMRSQRDTYSSVAYKEMGDGFAYAVKHAWDRLSSAPDRTEATRKLCADINKHLDDLWAIDNHTQVGRQLGFDHTDQSVYDALTTYIDTSYNHRQVTCARELGGWIRQHMTPGEQHPAPAKVEALEAKMSEVMQQYGIESPDPTYTWNLITLDLLGMSLCPEDEHNALLADDDDWNDDSEDTPNK